MMAHFVLLPWQVSAHVEFVKEKIIFFCDCSHMNRNVLKETCYVTTLFAIMHLQLCRIYEECFYVFFLVEYFLY